jgi:hypothetical protein
VTVPPPLSTSPTLKLLSQKLSLVPVHEKTPPRNDGDGLLLSSSSSPSEEDDLDLDEPKHGIIIVLIVTLFCK